MADELEQPNEPTLHSCARCHTLVEAPARMCVHCHNYVILALRLAVKSSALTDWCPEGPDSAWLNHASMMRNYAQAQQWIEWGAFVRWPVWLDLIQARAADMYPEFWEAEG